MKQKQKEKDLADEENFGNSSWGQFRAWLWNILEYPWTSRLAQVIRDRSKSTFFDTDTDTYTDTDADTDTYFYDCCLKHG